MAKDVVSIDSAFNMLSDGLLKQKKYDVGSFREFIENIWALSYDNPDYFKAWHVSALAEDVEECIENNLNYVCVLPRGHSTIMPCSPKLLFVLTMLVFFKQKTNKTNNSNFT